MIGTEDVVAATIAQLDAAYTAAEHPDRSGSDPVNLYQRHEAVCAKIITQGGSARGQTTRSPVGRYASVPGNVVGRRRSIVPDLFLQQPESGRVTITDKQMTSFSITLEQQ